MGNLIKQKESIVYHNHTIAHTHTKGSMEITGFLYDGYGVGSTGGCAADGAFYIIEIAEKGAIGDAADVKDRWRNLGFAASRSWTGETSQPSTAVSGFSGGNETRPSNYTIRIWKRIA